MADTSSRKLILYIACSLDGYIAGPGDDLGFLESVQEEGEDYGYEDFISGIDTVIMGRRTYEWVQAQGVKDPHPGRELIVLTTKTWEKEGNISFFSGNLQQLVEELKSLPGQDILCDGGSITVKQLLEHKLFDEIIISIIPVTLGGGIPLFLPDIPQLELKLLNSKSFTSGLVQLHYDLGQ